VECRSSLALALESGLIDLFLDHPSRGHAGRAGSKAAEARPAVREAAGAPTGPAASDGSEAVNEAGRSLRIQWLDQSVRLMRGWADRQVALSCADSVTSGSASPAIEKRNQNVSGIGGNVIKVVICQNPANVAT